MAQKRFLDLRKATKDEPKETLGKKLVKEQVKRRGAEKEVARLKEEVRILNQVIINSIDDKRGCHDGESV